MSEREGYLKAGRIASQVREAIRREVKPGVKVIDICDMVENQIRSLGGLPAFPCNVDIDQVAAHYVSPVGDQTVIKDGALVKVDIGVHVDGWIADTATTVCLDPALQPMAKAAEDSLETALKMIKPGVRAQDLGATIEHVIKNRGFRPIRNLTGHMLKRYVVHAGLSIPNVAGFELQKLEKGDVYAIEPFTVLPGSSGVVRDGPPSNIYRFDRKRNLTNSVAKEMLQIIQTEYKTLPFAGRWLLSRYPGAEGQRGFQELLASKTIEGYPQLVEKSGAKVAQAEHTVIVTEEGGVVTTR